MIVTPREELRNRLLRRVDWRFLLPAPQPEHSICFSDGPLAESVAFISKTIADPRRSPASECDLAVAINPTALTLQAAYTALRPGGAVYLEWHSPLAGGMKELRRRLEAAGFEAVKCYWFWPWPGRASTLFWLPLDAPLALRYYLRSRPRVRSLFAQANRGVLELGWQLGRRLGLVAPLGVVARKPAQVGASLPGLLESLRPVWNSALVGPVPTQLSWLVLTGGKRSINKVVGLVFAEGEARPRLALKLPRIVEAETSLLQEAEFLQAIHRQKEGGMPGVPQVVFCQKINDVLALGQTVLTGEPLFTCLRPDNYQEQALQGTRWLVELAGSGRAQPPAHWWPRLVEPVLDDFSAKFGPVLDAENWQKTQQILRQLGPLPLVIEHRDFAPWNVLQSWDGKLVVLDWESGKLDGLPALDLIYFVAHLGFFLEGAMESGQFCQVYRRLLNPATPVGQVFAESLEYYAGQLELKREALRPLRLLCWMLHSCAQYRHIVEEQGQNPSKEALRGSWFFNLWEEELSFDLIR